MQPFLHSDVNYAAGAWPSVVASAFLVHLISYFAPRAVVLGHLLMSAS